MHVFYLHGFASSARSSKAACIADRLRASGHELHTPDFNHPDFSTLTVTRMVGQVSAAIDALGPGPAALIGSSLGAFVAVQAALARPERVQRLVLLAPALDFGGNRMRSLGGLGLDEWQRTNRLDVFHFGFGKMMTVHYDLYADARRYDCLTVELPMPVQVFQGRQDAAVDPAGVEEWARTRPNVELHMLDDDHQLTASLPRIWPEMRRFLGLDRGAGLDGAPGSGRDGDRGPGGGAL
jgi:pimeloyl-ACP methyl ester carboxylesterase